MLEEHWDHIRSKGLLREKLASRRMLLSRLLLERVFSDSLQESLRDIDGTIKEMILEGRKYRVATSMVARRAIEKMLARVSDLEN